MKIKFKKLNDRAKIPFYANEGDAGMDLVATTVTRLSSFYEYVTDIAMQVPKGYVGLLFPRSSISNTDHYLRNSVGVIDSGYRGEIKILLVNLGQDKFVIEHSFRIAQLIIAPIIQAKLKVVLALNKTKRGQRGFGSTGQKA